MARWHDLPEDVTVYILQLRAQMLRRLNNSVKIQARWRCYRTFVLVARFKMLRYLATFRDYNPCASIFIRRARL